MDPSLKIGIVSGSIAGIISGIIATLVKIIQSAGFDLGIATIFMIPIVPVSVDAFVEIVYGLIFGIFLGIIYHKIYSIIQAKGIIKALLFGLFLYTFDILRLATIYAISGGYFIAVILFGLYIWIPFGIVLGISYEFLHRKYNITKQKPPIIQYNMMSALFPSVVAAFLGGMASLVIIFIMVNAGFWDYSYFVHVLPELPESSITSMNLLSPFEIPKLSYTVKASASELSYIELLISRFSLQTFFYFIWCTLFGLFFAKVYHLIPGKDFIKGLVYGLIGLIITEGRVIGYFIVQEYYLEVFGLHDLAKIIRFSAEQMVLLGSTVWIVFGIILGLLYRKPSE
ncbi:hypothetical protein [[Eubacterium] cellulosolvens]